MLAGRNDYRAGITALRAWSDTDNADVATLLDYASRKLGHYDDANYDKAFAADPNRRDLVLLQLVKEVSDGTRTYRSGTVQCELGVTACRDDGTNTRLETTDGPGAWPWSTGSS
jgi:hypothetical protein